MPRATKTASDKGLLDPNKLVRQRAGTYRTADDRFEVRQGGTGWFMVDSVGTNEFGQDLVRGPFPTLGAVRDALPDARRTTLRSLSRARAGKAGKAGPARRAKPQPPPPPPSWIDQLPRAEAASARALIRALERQGLTDADELVRSDRDGRKPVVATRLLEQRLAAMVADLPASERDGARRLIRRVTELLTAEGSTVAEPLPGWTLLELGREPEPPGRRIVLRRPPEVS